jgi:hypothetical protein
LISERSDGHEDDVVGEFSANIDPFGNQQPMTLRLIEPAEDPPAKSLEILVPVSLGEIGYRIRAAIIGSEKKLSLIGPDLKCQSIGRSRGYGTRWDRQRLDQCRGIGKLRIEQSLGSTHTGAVPIDGSNEIAEHHGRQQSGNKIKADRLHDGRIV